MKLFKVILLFLLFVNLSYSQQSCTTVGDCTDGPDDPICQSSIPECIESVCVYEAIPNCCTSNEACGDILLEPCVSGYTCNAETNQCDPIMKECENGRACTDYCVTNETACETRICIASTDVEIDSTCQIGLTQFECDIPQNKCMTATCYYGYGCQEYDGCGDGLGCTIDTCDPVTGCIHTPVNNCTECDGYGCITEDACLPSLCVGVFSISLRGGSSRECHVFPINCTIDNPCLINGVCVNGECEYENICSSEETTTDTTTGPITTSPVTTITSGPITTIATSASTVATSTGITISSSIGGYESDEYIGPKYPKCLSCKDLNCEKMGRRCKLLKSYNKNCYEDDHQQKKFKHHDKHHNKDQDHNNPHQGHQQQQQHHPHDDNNNQHGHYNPHHQNPHQSNGHYNPHHQQQQQYQKENGGYGHHSQKSNYNNNYNQNGGAYGNTNQYENDNQYDDEFYYINNIKYPRELGPFDCCPYQPTCY